MLCVLEKKCNIMYIFILFIKILRVTQRARNQDLLNPSSPVTHVNSGSSHSLLMKRLLCNHCFLMSRGKKCLISELRGVCNSGQHIISDTSRQAFNSYV